MGASGLIFSELGVRVRDWVRGSPVFALGQVEVTGHETLSLDEIRALHLLEPGTPLLEIDVRAVGRAIEKHPCVLRATVTRSLPDRVRVRVMERMPVAQVLLDRWYEVDETGVVLGEVRRRFEHDLPKFFGVRPARPPAPGDRLEDDVTRRLLALVGALDAPPLRDRGLRQRMSLFLVSEDGGLAVPLGSSPATLLLGREDWVRRVEKLAVVEPQTGGLDSEPTLIDLRFEGLVVVGPMPAWGKDLARANSGA